MFIKSIKYTVYLGYIWLALFPLSSCQKKGTADKIKVDFSLREEIPHFAPDSQMPLAAAVSALISPQENFLFYNGIFEYVSEKIGRKIIYKQRKTYREVNDLLSRQDLDFAFIGAGAYVEAKKEFDAQILAVPQIGQKAESSGYIIVRKTSKLAEFEDLKDRSFAFTDPLSNTGCIYPTYLVKVLHQAPEKFFSRVIFTYAHDYSIQAVAGGIVDAAGVNSLIFDYIQKNHPEKTAAVKIIKKSMPFGMPPFVVNPKIDPNLKNSLQKILLDMGDDPEGRAVLLRLGIERFVPGNDGEYGFIRTMNNIISDRKS
jgi:phosphonate transport system substrate-binding protein